MGKIQLNTAGAKLLTVTYKVASTDAVQAIAAAKHTVSDQSATSAIISFETDEIRVGFGVDPTQNAGTGLGHQFAAEDVLQLESWDMIRNFRFISADAGAHGSLQITLMWLAR